MSGVRSFLCALIFALCAQLAAAQTDPPGGIDYEVWDSLADFTEAAVDEQKETTQVFEGLRGRIADFRSQFSDARDANRDRIETLRDQLSALGPVPESGVEADDIAIRRADLEDRLRALEAPGLVADAAFQRADGIIRQIDSIIRDREANRLLELGPAPVNPANWGLAYKDVSSILGDISHEFGKIRGEEHRSQIQDDFPLILLYFAVGSLLLARGRHWAGLLLERLRTSGGKRQVVWQFLISLFRIVLPLAGIVAIVHAVGITGLAGARFETLLYSLPIWGAILLGFRWLSERLFSRHDDEALIPLVPERRTEARFYVFILSIAFVLRGIVAVVLGLAPTSAETEAVVTFPIIVLIGVILLRFGQILRGFNPHQDEDNADDTVSRPSGMKTMVRICGTLAMGIAVAAPVMAAVGYGEAGNALLFPAINSLCILGLVVVLQRFAADVYGLVTGKGAEGRDALVPVLMGFFLILLSLPFLALAWGIRQVELLEIWNRLGEGFQVGDSRISPTDFLMFALIFGIGYMLTRFVQGALKTNVLPKTKIDPGGQTAIVSGLGYLGIFLAAIAAITTVGIDLSSVAIVAGALSVGIGFGLQTIVSNFISGIILLIERPITEGDWIEVGGQMGYVRHISVRSTRIETFDRSDVIVPNADLISGTVTNYTRGNTVGRLIVDVGVAYGTDTRRVEAILKEIADAQPMVLRNPPPMILFNAFGADALEFQVRMILRDVNWMMAVKNDVNHAIAQRFAEEGIEVPFAQRDLWLRNPEVLKGADT